MAAKKHCLRLLSMWAESRATTVRSTASVKAADKRAPYSELCMATRCAGKPIRAFAISASGHGAGIVYTDKSGCHFASGLTGEVLPFDLRRGAGLSGARRRRRR